TQATLENALGEVPDGVDLILVEGFRESGYPKILVAQSETEAEEQLDKIREIIAISGPVAHSGIQQLIRGVPVRSSEDLLKSINRMVQENQVKPL
ncbi:molybdopterin-guanine dinucleotide biosynthesis protein MobB, partial [Candidatus Bathyarchaeota archaeon]|nr:molybdopterin-guanine dinucleotide biosynthesis protein MobB [Candidatus Bathyarchaeota archaeon]